MAAPLPAPDIGQSPQNIGLPVDEVTSFAFGQQSIQQDRGLVQASELEQADRFVGPTGHSILVLVDLALQPAGLPEMLHGHARIAQRKFHRGPVVVSQGLDRHVADLLGQGRYLSITGGRLFELAILLERGTHPVQGPDGRGGFLEILKYICGQTVVRDRIGEPPFLAGAIGQPDHRPGFVPLVAANAGNLQLLPIDGHRLGRAPLLLHRET